MGKSAPDIEEFCSASASDREFCTALAPDREEFGTVHDCSPPDK